MIAHMLQYHALKQKESESGAEYVDREIFEYLALRDMGIYVDNSVRLTKFIFQDTINSSHKQLAPTIFTTPYTTLGRATSLFEMYNPPSTSTLTSDTPTVNTLYFVGTAKEMTINYHNKAPRKSPVSKIKVLKKNLSLHLHAQNRPRRSGYRVRSVTPPLICSVIAILGP